MGYRKVYRTVDEQTTKKIRLLKKRKKRKRKNLVLTDGTSLTSSRSVIIHKKKYPLWKNSFFRGTGPDHKGGIAGTYETY